jgi:PKHD-type hydroxylase
MNHKYSYWYFQSILSDKNCSDIIKLGNSKKLNLAITGTESAILKQNKNLSKKQISNLKKMRNSKIVFLNDNWLYELITPYINQANKAAGWNYEINWNESFQYTSYKKNQHYDWHQDSWDEPYKSEDVNFNNKIRKISVICSLTDPKEYEGGKLEFWYGNPHNKKIKPVECKEINKKGSIVIFPSYNWHRVTPITKGHRNSLVMWSLGPSFK